VLPMDGVLRARGFTRAIFLSYLTKALVTLPLVYLGVRHFGMSGGIASWALAELVGKATLLLPLPRALSTPARPLHLRDVIPWRQLGQAGLSAVAAALGVTLLRLFLGHAYLGLPTGFVWRALPLAVAGILFATGYVAVLHATGVRLLGMIANLRLRRAA
jgi:hypothetical protein